LNGARPLRKGARQPAGRGGRSAKLWLAGIEQVGAILAPGSARGADPWIHCGDYSAGCASAAAAAGAFLAGALRGLAAGLAAGAGAASTCGSALALAGFFATAFGAAAAAFGAGAAAFTAGFFACGAVAGVQRTHCAGQFVDALGQLLQFLAARDAERAERLGNAVLEHLLQAIPGIGRAFLDLRNGVLDHATDFLDLVAGELAGRLFQRRAFLDQRLVELAALLLRLGERAPRPASQICSACSMIALAVFFSELSLPASLILDFSLEPFDVFMMSSAL
jgi:hypothetical protein